MAFDFMRGTRNNVVDLAVQGGLNWFGTGKAAESPDLRWTWGKPGEPSSMFRDYRFAGGVAGLAVHAFAGDNMLGRAGYDLASGSLHSLIATERIRKGAMDRIQQGAQQGQQAQMPGGQQPAFGNPANFQQPAGGGAGRGVFANFVSQLPGNFA